MDVTVIRSNRKTVAIQVNADLSVTLRVPLRISKRDIDLILKEKEPWGSMFQHCQMRLHFITKNKHIFRVFGAKDRTNNKDIRIDRQNYTVWDVLSQ